MKIGITFDPPTNQMDIFSNGIKQHAVFFYDLLKNCGYNPYFIIPKDTEKNLTDIYSIDKDVNFCIYNDILSANFNLVFQFQFQLGNDALIELRKMGVKIVLYKCGNDYVMDLEDVLHSTGRKDNVQYGVISDINPVFDQVWSIPQHESTNYYYWKTLYKTEVKVVNHIWSPNIIEKFELLSSRDFMYKRREEEKKIAIFEPNLNVVKWFWPALLVCENAERSISSKIKYVYLTNIEPKNIDVDKVNEIVQSLDLYKQKKISIEARYNSLIFMSSFADIAVSHQWENPLNYLYFDLAWFGWPILHNANLCKDIGYYYEGFNYEEGGKILEKIIKTHDKNFDSYIEKNRKLLDRYRPTNIDNQNHYKKLIEDLFK